MLARPKSAELPWHKDESIIKKEKFQEARP